jgi:hypothetical protein
MVRRLFGAFTRFEGPNARFPQVGVNSTGGDVIYPASELAQRHGVGVRTTTSESKDAYADNAEDVAAPNRDGWLPG